MIMARIFRLPFFIALLSCLLLSSLACNYDDRVVTVPGDETSDTDEPDAEEEPDVEEEPDEEEPDEELGPVDRSLFTNCAAGGVASGSGFELTHCTGPAEAGAETLSGSGFTLQAGPFRQISPAQ